MAGDTRRQGPEGEDPGIDPDLVVAGVALRVVLGATVRVMLIATESAVVVLCTVIVP